MKKVLVAVLFAGAAIAGGAGVYAEESQALTRALPVVADFTVTSGSTIGKSLQLVDVDAFRVSVCATSGQTLSGAGTLQAYLLDERAGLVKRNPSLDLSVSVTATSCGGAGCRCQVFPDQEVGVPYHRVIYATSGVTVSGGTTVDVRIRGWARAGK